MRKRVLLLVFGFMLVAAFLVNVYSQMTYNMNAFEMFFSDHELTEEERTYLKAKGPLIYGSDDNSPPLRFYDTESGEYKGLAVDYLRALAIELETEIEFVPMIWDDALKALAKGETDLCDMFPSKKRASLYLFSDPIYYQRGILVVPKQSAEIRHVGMLKGKRVALQRGDYVHEYLVNSGPPLEFVFTRDYEESLDLLLRGEVDAIAGDEPVISYFLDQLELTNLLSIVETPLYELPMVLSTHKDDKMLQQILNKGIYAVTQKSIITKIQQKWFGISTSIGADVKGQRIRLLFLSFAAGATFVVAMVLLWNLELKKAVKLRTEALEISRNNLRTMIDGLSHMIVVVADDWSILSYNRHFEDRITEVLGGERPLDQPKVIGDYIVGWNEWAKKEWADSYMPAERILYGRTYRITPYPVRYNADHQNSLLIVFEDVTDQHLHAAKLLQENKMSAVGQLATGVAHEIRNPLGLIRNYTFLINRAPDDKALLKEGLAVIEDSVYKASATIDNLLNFSRMTNDSVTRFDLKHLVENVVRLNDKLMLKGHVRCVILLETMPINWCEGALRHILMNLINNAIDAISNSGQLTIWASRTADGVMIHVIDNGMGMSEDTIQRLYDPFFTTKQIGEGTGLGLYIVYNELEKHGGRLEVRSKLGKGTTFKLRLNCKDA